MFFNFFFLRVNGNSMGTFIPHQSFVLVKSDRKFYKISKLLVFKHKKYGRLIKKLVKIDKNNFYWFEGLSNESISQKKIGPISKESIFGKVVLSIDTKKIKLHL